MLKIKKIIIYLLFFQFSIVQCADFSNINTSIITYNMCRCRFGSRIIAYVKTKWLAYKYNIPFFYEPFEYSDQLMISKLEKRYDKNMEKYFNKVIYFEEDPQVIIDREAKYVYVGDYYTNITVDFTDEQFIKTLKKTIAPITPIEKPIIPISRISVAVHIRRGGGYDPPLSFDPESHKNFVDHVYPGKFLPDEYYIKQITNLYEACNETPMHVHVFTDDKNPNRFIETYKKALHTKNITFSTRKSGNFTKNVIDDFFSMAYYDCLIMPDSGFSWCVKQILGDFFIVISTQNSKIKVEVNLKNFHKIAKLIGNISNVKFNIFNPDSLHIS